MSLTIICALKKRKMTVLSLIVGILGLAGFYCYYHNNKPKRIAHNLYNILEQHRILYDIDARTIDATIDTQPKPVIGKEKFIEQLSEFIARNNTINFLLVCFPFKSANTEHKTIGYLPDLAERKSLEYLQTILSNIGNVYKPGVHLTIVCDGIPYAQSFHIPFEHVQQYEKTLKILGTDFPNIHFYTSAELMKMHGLKSINQINFMIDQYNPAAENFRSKMSPLSADITRKRLALEFDYPAAQEWLMKQSLDDIVFNLLLRQERFRNYLSEAFPASEYIRLSAHFSSDVSKKFGINLSPHSCVTPFHGVLVEEIDGSWSIQFKKNVDLTKYQLLNQNINGVKCPYFKRI